MSFIGPLVSTQGRLAGSEISLDYIQNNNVDFFGTPPPPRPGWVVILHVLNLKVFDLQDSGPLLATDIGSEGHLYKRQLDRFGPWRQHQHHTLQCGKAGTASRRHQPGSHPDAVQTLCMRR